MSALAIVPGILAVSLLIVVHEAGHYLAARRFGMKVERFSIGFGPVLLAFRRRETEFAISALPLGGYVKMVGEGDENELSPEDQERSFAGKPPLQRIVIVAAGPVFNIVFAYLIFVLVSMIGFPVETARVGEVIKDKPAASQPQPRRKPPRQAALTPRRLAHSAGLVPRSHAQSADRLQEEL